MLARVRSVAAPTALVDLYGSSVYAPKYASDVDVLVSHDDAFRLASLLGLELIPTTPPRLHGVVDGVTIDITVVNGEDLEAQKRRAGPRDAALLVKHLGDRHGVFVETWPHVKQFVHRRALGHNGLGWFGSFGWAILLAIPVATMRAIPAGEMFPTWLRWLATLTTGTRVALGGIREGVMEPLYVEAPASPVRDVANLTPRAGAHLFTEAQLNTLAIREAVTDADAIARIIDIADAPPPGETLVVSGSSEASRGRYDGLARRMLRDLEALGPTRSWGRFEHTPDGWEHRITVSTQKAAAARELIEHWLVISNLDAFVE